MRAQNLAISLPNEGCDKNCPYCVSNMTGRMRSDWALMKRNAPKVREFAYMAQIGSVLLTGKGEPMLNYHNTIRIMEYFQDFPIELQTNGKILKREECSAYIEDLYERGLNVLAISVDTTGEMRDFEPLVDRAVGLGVVVRFTIAVTDRTADYTLDTLMQLMGRASQLTFRQVTIPNHGVVDTIQSETTQDWIRRHVTDKAYKYTEDIKYEIIEGGRKIRWLPYGTMVYGYGGKAVTCFDYCVQDGAGENNIRSLIFQEDGHLYTAWNSTASILF
jgi:hypothetical protein